MKKALLAIVAVVVATALGVGAWAAFGAENDDEGTARGTCGNVTYELSAEDDDGGVEVTFEVQSAAPGETWQVVIEQDGTRSTPAPARPTRTPSSTSMSPSRRRTARRSPPPRRRRTASPAPRLPLTPSTPRTTAVPTRNTIKKH